MNLTCNKDHVEAKLKELFILSMEGDSYAYEQFLTLVSMLVKRHTYFMGGKNFSVQSLEEVNQEIILKVHHKKHTYRPEMPILPWIYAISKYAYIDFYRHQRKLNMEVEMKDDHAKESDSSDALDFEEILDMLTPKQRELLVMIKIDGLSYNEAAVAMNASVSSLKVSLHRTIKSIQERMSK